jgi:hypothetical protein
LGSSGQSDGSLEAYYRVLQLSPAADLELVERAYWLLAFRYHQQGQRGELQRLNQAMSSLVLALGGPAARAAPGAPPDQQRPRLLPALLTELGWLIAAASTVSLALGLAVGAVEPQGRLQFLVDWRGAMLTGGIAGLAGVVSLAALFAISRALSRLTRSAASPAPGLDPYEVLHLDPSATSEVVELAYAHLARKYGLAGDQASLLAVEEAHRLLSDPDLRAAYDAQLASKAAAAPAPAPAGKVPRVAPPRPPAVARAPAARVAAARVGRGLTVAAVVLGRGLWRGWRWSWPRLARGAAVGGRALLLAASAAARGIGAALASRRQQGAPVQAPTPEPTPAPAIQRLRRVQLEATASSGQGRPTPPFQAPVRPPTARLVVVEGPLAGRSFELRADAAVTVGSDPDCEIVLEPAEGLTVPQLARIWPREDRFMLHLLAPDVPASVQGRPLVWVVLEDGDLIELGPYRLRFEVLHHSP